MQKDVFFNIINELHKTNHFKKRIIDRLFSDNSTFIYEKESNKKIVFEKLNFLEKVNFPGQENWMINIFRGNDTYIYHDKQNKEYSEGKYILIAIQANSLETVFFNPTPIYVSKNQRSIQINFDTLKNYILNQKNGNFFITEKDIKNIIEKKTFKDTQSLNKKEYDLITRYEGKNYFVDFKSNELINKNNPNKKIPIFDIIHLLDVNTAEEVLKRLS